MSRVKLAVLAIIGLLGLPLSACSLSEPAPKDFVLVNEHAAEDAPPDTPTGTAGWTKIGKQKGGHAKTGHDKGARAAAGAPTVDTVEAACKAETERKGIASMVAIFSRLRKGSADADYIACMKAHGFEVKP